MNWLMKEEPANYSFDDLVRDRKTSWTGVKNALAQKHLRSIQKGDRIFVYHSGDERAVIGTARRHSPARSGAAFSAMRRVSSRIIARAWSATSSMQ